jgi:predicted RNA binding protein YcfA (HicA-like mRNA interferase family)
MSDKLPVVRVTETIRKLRKAGFIFDRQAKGSHEIWYNPQTQRRVVIPNHPGDIPKGTLRKIIQQAGLTVDEFISL